MGSLSLKAVRDAAKVIEAFDPEWYYKVDINRLDMESTVNCILAQVFYSDAYFGGEWTYWDRKMKEQAYIMDIDLVPGVFAANFDKWRGETYFFLEAWIDLIKEKCNA